MSVASLRSFEYLEGLSGSELTRLYNQPSTALAIFRRMLPHLAKSLVLSILYIPDPLARADLEAWVKSDHKRDLDSALLLLQRLHIFDNVRAEGTRPAGFALTNAFGNSLRAALTGSPGHNSFGVPVDTPASKRVSLDELDEYARTKWEGMLGYMVATTADIGSQFRGVDSTVAVVLELGDYVEKKGGGRISITKGGFELLMQKTNAQVWALLVTYLNNKDTTGINPTEGLSFFFMLGSLELGQAYSTSNLTETQRTVLEDLSALGLIYRSSKSSSKFYPTRLATTLTSDSPALREASSSTTSTTTTTATGNALAPAGASTDDSGPGTSNADGFIVIETNYRLYAYTTSPLQIAILQLFTKLETKYPNMVSGRLTRTSVHKAIEMGITADQIIDFLSTHAHPQMRRGGSGMPGGMILPPTVMDQIRLWQLENERMATTPGFLFKEIDTQEDYEKMTRYADEIGVLKWKNDRRRLFFVTRYEQVASYYKNHIQRRVADPRAPGR